MASSLNIVFVEDNDFLRDATVAMLCANGHRASGVMCAEDLLETSAADVYIVDINLPGEDGFSLTRRLRAAMPRVGIIMFTARAEVSDRVAGYEGGADIYLEKPVSPDEMLAAIGSIGRRLLAERSGGEAVRLESLTQSLAGPGGRVTLTHSEAQLLSRFVMAPDHRLERWQVMEVLGLDLDQPSSGSLEVRIAALRKKIAAATMESTPLRSIRNLGYRLCVDVRLT